MTEYEQAIILANKVLERPNADPDDDLAVLARQFLRQVESQQAVRKQTKLAIVPSTDGLENKEQK